MKTVDGMSQIQWCDLIRSGYYIITDRVGVMSDVVFVLSYTLRDVIYTEYDVMNIVGVLS